MYSRVFQLKTQIAGIEPLGLLRRGNVHQRAGTDNAVAGQLVGIEARFSTALPLLKPTLGLSQKGYCGLFRRS